MQEKIADGPVLKLIESFLKANILDGAEQWTPEAGAPQGAVLSPLLSNAYLDPLDHQMAEAGWEMVRYADDFVILCRTAEDAQKALTLVQAWVTENGLTLHPTKTRIVEATSEGFDFLGYHFRGSNHWPRKKSIQKLKDSLRMATGRSSGRSLSYIIAVVNQRLRGWFAYFKHSVRWEFPPLDGWLRRRLRSILRNRSKRRGIAKSADNGRWPNTFFAKHRLFSLEAAHRLACQSLQR